MWVDTEILYANDLNQEINNILNNGLSLISPLTAALDCNGFALQNVAAGTVTSPGLYFSSDANTGLYRSAADTVDVAVGGVRGLQVSTVASAVNYLDLAPSATGTAVTATAEGTDTNISINLVPKGTGTVQAGGGDLAPAGALMPYAGSSTPTGWLLCDGTAVSRTTYARLFAAIGTTWGVGDGSTTFNLPDLRDRVIYGVSVTKTLGLTGGSDTIAEAQLPSHTHDLSNHTHDISHTHTLTHFHATTGSSTGHVIPDTTQGLPPSQTDYSTDAASTATSGVPSTNTSGATGSGTAFFPQYAALRWIVRA